MQADFHLPVLFPDLPEGHYRPCTRKKNNKGQCAGKEGIIFCYMLQRSAENRGKHFIVQSEHNITEGSVRAARISDGGDGGNATSQHVAMDTNTGTHEALEHVEPMRRNQPTCCYGHEHRSVEAAVHVEPVNQSDGGNANSQHVAMDTNTGASEAAEHVSRSIHPMAATQPANMLLWTRTPERPRQPSTLSRSIHPTASTQPANMLLWTRTPEHTRHSST
ncbi:hypothetical protein niasHT_013965 [Heterodera trifolii]|uniref:Uncharacterized protein n=1 Tax=Heterodera trifolii TaxID=157864 RepID=A0ABD2KLG6_9BILA